MCFAEPSEERFVDSCGHLQKDDLDHLLVKFPERDFNVSAPPPDPKLLALHAVCARVAHMSGAAEAFDEFDRDLEDTIVLAEDGSSARLLDHVLTPFAVITSA